MAAPAGFSDLIARKYDILQQNADSEAGLRGAQATGILGSLDSENALRGAQAFSTREQGKTLGPLAQASQAATYAGIPLTQAQTGLVGAQAGEIGFNTTAAASPFERGNYWDQTQYPNGNGLGAARAGQSGGLSFSAGTASVPAQAPAKGAAKGSKPQAPAMPPTPLVAPHGGVNLHGVMAHALNALHAAGGATTVLPVRSVPSEATMGEENRQANFALTSGQQMSRNVGLYNDSAQRSNGGPHYASGTPSVNAKQGKTAVPGKGAPNVDSVKATLAPQEAVLNAGAAAHVGRGTIAALNALGAAKMTQAGMPPETPPTVHGVQAPARGAPSKAAAKPLARGMPPKGKAPPPKVAANGKGK